MSSTAEVVEKNEKKYLMPEERLNELCKKWYGLNDKDVEELMVFVNEFDESATGIKEGATYDDLKPIVDSGNKIPSHCGYMITHYFVNRHGETEMMDLISKIYIAYKPMNEADPENTKTTDLYETLACLIMYCPHKVLRMFINRDFETAQEIYKIMRKRPGTNAVMSSCFSELYVSNKFDAKYSDLIYDNFQAMLDFLAKKNNTTDDVPDAVMVNFNQLRDIIQIYLDNNKKESLKKINNLINKKADIGEAFFYWVSCNPSSAMEVLYHNEKFNGIFIEKFLHQLKVQHVAELMTTFENLPPEKMKESLEYIKNTFKLESYDACYDRLVKLIQKGGIFHYGILLRHIEFYPNMPMMDGEGFAEPALRLQSKLSSVANNLTADISEKSLSITIAPLGRSRVYQDIVDVLEGVDKNGGGFLAKLRDKDVIKKIRESGASYFALDQQNGATMITILEVINNICSKNPNLEGEELTKALYKELVITYGEIMTMPYFVHLLEGFSYKFQPDNAEEDDGKEDYEEI